MFGWFKTKSPLSTDQRSWIESRFAWLRKEFGDTRLRNAVVTPTDEFFPEPYYGTEDDAAALLSRVCRYMDVDPSRVDLSFYTAAAADDVTVGFNPWLGGFALGTYSKVGDRMRVVLEKTRLREPASVVATIAHELGHVHLLGDQRISPDAEDHERLTDLLTVFFGMGIFTANSSIREANWRAGQFSGWNMSRQGYLLLPEYAYALAAFANARHEMKPVWTQHLRPDLRALFKTEAKRLIDRGTGDGFADDNQSPAPDESEIASDDAPREETASDDVENATESDAPAEVANSASGKTADQYFTEGVAFAAQKQYKFAIDCFSHALELNPDDSEVRLNRVRAYNALGEHAKVIDDCTRAIGDEPDEGEAFLRRGWALASLREYAAALKDSENAVRLRKKDPNAYLLRGIVLAGLGELRQAITAYKNAIQYAPNWADNYLGRSQVYEALGDANRAQADLSEAIRREPAFADKAIRERRLAGRRLISAH